MGFDHFRLVRSGYGMRVLMIGRLACWLVKDGVRGRLLRQKRPVDFGYGFSLLAHRRLSFKRLGFGGLA
jgi:hypothetical protein